MPCTRDHLAVDLDPALLDELLAGAPAAEPGRGQHPLQPDARLVVVVVAHRAGSRPCRRARPSSGRNGARSGSSSRRAARAAPGSSDVVRYSDRAALAVVAGLLDQAAGDQGAHHAVDVDAAHRGDPRPAHRLPVGDDGERLERGLGQPGLLAVEHEPLDVRRARRPGCRTASRRRPGAARSRGPARRTPRRARAARATTSSVGRSATWASVTSLDRLVDDHQDRLERGAQRDAVVRRASIGCSSGVVIGALSSRRSIVVSSGTSVGLGSARRCSSSASVVAVVGARRRRPRRTRRGPRPRPRRCRSSGRAARRAGRPARRRPRPRGRARAARGTARRRRGCPRSRRSGPGRSRCATRRSAVTRIAACSRTLTCGACRWSTDDHRHRPAA